MMKLLALSIFFLIFATSIEGRRRPPPPPKPKGKTTQAPTVAPPTLPPSEAPPTEAPTEAPTTEAPSSGPTTEVPPANSAIGQQVLDMVNEGVEWNGSVLGLYDTCWWSTYSQYIELACGDNAEGYYEELDYGEDWRIIITSGAPSHDAEEHSTPFCTAYTDICHAINPLINGGILNPNRRCEKWQYVVLPKNPALMFPAEVFSDTPMGATGFATSGGHIYNHLASPDGSVAWYHEIQSLDLGMGHSDPSGNYHYHGVPYLIPGADDAATCTKVGYLFDGYPVYGMCEDENGNEMQSCWKLIDGHSGEYFDDYYYDDDGFAAGTCHLDRANGITFADGYRYVTTTNFPGIPMFYSGTSILDLAGRTYTGPCGFYPL